MSLYAKYLKERTPGVHILETSKGFATYIYIPQDKAVYIQDLYVLPEYRKAGYASKLANTIAFRAKELGLTHMVGTVNHRAEGADISAKVLEGYGMAVHLEGPEFTIYSKHLQDT